MEKKNTKTRPDLTELIPDKERRQEIVSRLYQGDPIVGKDGIFTDLLQALVNASLEGEMDYHLTQNTQEGRTNRRNGHTQKTVRSHVGPMQVKTPRDRDGSHDPLLIKKWERELGAGMDHVILSLYARGQSVEDVRYQLRELYGLEVSAGTISAVTDRVLEEIITWQQRPLSACYTIIYLDAIHFKVRSQGKVESRATYSTYAITVDGERDLLGLYISEAEGANQWGLILEDLKRRGVEDVLFFCIDGLSGFKDVIEQVYPASTIQRCIVHMVRNSTRFVSDKDKRELCRDLKVIYSSQNRIQAELALEAFGLKWDHKYKEIRPKWEKSWDELMSYMDYGENIRRMIYTTNPVEALHRVIRKVTKSKGAWVNEKGLTKQLYLTLMHNQKSWKKKAFGWTSTQRELMIKFGDRYEKHL